MAESDGDIGEQIRALEETLLTPAVRSSEEALTELLADEFAEFGRSGRTYDKRTIIDALVRERSPLECRLEDFSARRLGPGIVLVTYRSSCSGGQGARRVTLRSSIWIYRRDRWQLVFHQGTPAPHETA
jgi:hypothetical protein